MPRILILTSASGAGHLRVAQTIAQALASRGGHGQVLIADPLSARLTRLYGPLIVRVPWLWGIVYHLADRQCLFSRGGRAWSLVDGAMRVLLEETSPDLVLSVHPLCHGLALHSLRELGASTPVATMVTDLLAVHAAWYHPAVQLYMVPTAQAAGNLLALGCGESKVHVLGLPVGGSFRDGREEREERRWQLGLEPGRWTVLVTGGGEGAGPIMEAARTVAAGFPGSQLVVACGRNRGLHRRLQGCDLGVPVRALGFVDDLARWMLACDVVVAKAGAVTVAEAAAARRPLLIMDALPGQEKGNLRFVEESGIGLLARPRKALAKALFHLREGTLSLPWEENMARVDRPEASSQIARLLLDMVDGRG